MTEPTRGPKLTPEEDAALRRLHYFEELGCDLAEPVAELKQSIRRSDRRKEIREPKPEDVATPAPPGAADDAPAAARDKPPRAPRRRR